MLKVDIDRIPIGKITQIRLFTDHRNWVQSPASAQAPVFVAPSGLTIVAQQIADDHTALLSVNPSNANSLSTLTDTLNKEAVTLKCWDTPQFQAMGESAQTGDQTPQDESDNPIDDGYWDQWSVGGFGLGII